MSIKWRLINIFRLLIGLPIIIPGDGILFSDVDETLAMWQNGGTYIPHRTHLELVHRFARRGLPVVVWSAGGYKWADQIVSEYGLNRKVAAVMAKPRWYIDDVRSDEFMPEVNRIYKKDEGGGQS